MPDPIEPGQAAAPSDGGQNDNTQTTQLSPEDLTRILNTHRQSAQRETQQLINDTIAPMQELLTKLVESQDSAEPKDPPADGDKSGDSPEAQKLARDHEELKRRFDQQEQRLAEAQRESDRIADQQYLDNALRQDGVNCARPDIAAQLLAPLVQKGDDGRRFVVHEDPKLGRQDYDPQEYITKVFKENNPEIFSGNGRRGAEVNGQDSGTKTYTHDWNDVVRNGEVINAELFASDEFTNALSNGTVRNQPAPPSR